MLDKKNELYTELLFAAFYSRNKFEGNTEFMQRSDWVVKVKPEEPNISQVFSLAMKIIAIKELIDVNHVLRWIHSTHLTGYMYIKITNTDCLNNNYLIPMIYDIEC